MNRDQGAEPGDAVPSRPVLSHMRMLLPARPLEFSEALRIAELQANRLLELRGMADDVPIIENVVTDLPRIIVDYELDMPCSGASTWDSHRKVWVITLNALEPRTRQRLSLLHEFKHIIDHGGPGLVDMGDRTFYGHTPTEYLAEYFAGCALMPKRLVRRAWVDGIQRVRDLAELFEVSERAMDVRLDQLRLWDAPSYRRAVCARPNAVGPNRRRRQYRRSLSPSRPVPEVAR